MCTNDGEERRECPICGAYESKVVEKLGHDYKSSVTEPTCTEKGYTTHTCTRCDDSYTDTIVEKLGHKYGEWKQAKAPTCITDSKSEHIRQ